MAICVIYYHQLYNYTSLSHLRGAPHQIQPHVCLISTKMPGKFFFRRPGGAPAPPPLATPVPRIVGLLFCMLRFQTNVLKLLKILLSVCSGPKPGAKDLKPPDLWIHDRVGQRRTSHASNSAVSSAGGAPSVAGSGSQDVNDDSRQ